MSLYPTQADQRNQNKMLHELADLCAASSSCEKIEACLLRLDEKTKKLAQAIYYYPLYDMSLISVRLRALTGEPEAINAWGSGSTRKACVLREKVFGELLFKNMWAFKRSFPASEKAPMELCIQYSRPPLSNDHSLKKYEQEIEETFHLNHLCNDEFAFGARRDRQYSFWTPDLLKCDQMLSFNRSGNALPLSTRKGSWKLQHEWDQMSTDGGWNVCESYHAETGKRELTCYDLTAQKGDYPFKTFQPCTMREMSDLLFQLAQRRHRLTVRPPNSTVHTISSQMHFFQVDSASVIHAFISSHAIGLKLEHVWIMPYFNEVVQENKVENDAKPWPHNRSFKLTNGSMLDLTSNNMRLNHGGSSFSMKEIAVPEDCLRLGMRQVTISSCAYEFRMSSPATILSEEVTNFVEVMRETLQACGHFPQSLMKIILDYWNIKVLTLPKEG